MYKLIVSDFDNTLIDSEETIPLSTILLFDEIRRKGIKVSIATGRCLKSVLDYNKDVIFCDYLITSNGAYIYDTVLEKVIFKKNIGIRSIKRIIKEFKDRTIIYLTDHNTWNLISDKSIYENDYDVIKVLDTDKFLEENKTNIYKIELYFKTLSLARKGLKEINDMNLNINANLQINNNKFIIEITDSSVSKLDGLNKILNKEKLKLDEVIAFGDGYNDKELLKKTGLGIAVDNALPEIKKVANDITTSNNLKGVENYLKKIF